ncbi:DUF481 domain-containing protein [Dongshaea marina]|uniref:DUF481 domain-containing protein n=1 Tax=Dongshaea marina TaxID=2047966 RepID=UPI000D3E1139|nr:DUF481 domain-containing protein [Dongshaea marina]
MKSLMILLPLMAVASCVQAAEKAKDSPYSGSAQLGYFYSKSDSTSTSLNTRLKFGYQGEEVGSNLDFQTFYTKSSGDSSTNKYTLTNVNNYNLTERQYLFGRLQYDHDLYGAFRQKVTGSAGYGVRIVKTDASSLTFDIGPGYRFSEEQKASDGSSGERESEMIGHAGLKGDHKFSDTLEIGANLMTDAGEKNTVSTAEFNLKNTLIGNLALVLSTQYIYTDRVPEGQSNDEVFNSINLSYGF